MNKLTTIEKLTLAQAIFKVVGDAVSTKNPSSVRAQVDEEMLKAYELDGIKSRDLRINGEKVGTYTVRVSKSKMDDVLSETDHDAFVKWAGENPEICTLFAISAGAKLAQFALDTAGELPDGYEINHIVIPEHATGTTLKVDEQKVAHAMGNELPSVVAGLLGGE